MVCLTGCFRGWYILVVQKLRHLRIKCSYLLCRHGIFYFRQVIQPHLQPVLERREIKFSLHTSVASTAVLRCEQVVASLTHLMEDIRILAKLNEARATAIAHDYLQKEIHRFEDMFKGGAGNLDLIKEELAKRVWRAKKDHRGSLEGNVSNGAKDRAEDVLIEAGEPRPEWDSPEFEAFTRKIILAHFEDARIATARFDRDHASIAIQNSLFAGLDVGLVRHPTAQVVAATTPPSPNLATGLTIIEAKNKYVKANEKSWQSGKTCDEKTRILLWFIEFMEGKSYLTQITDADMREFRDALTSIPGRINNVPKLRKMPFKKLIKVPESHRRIGPNTTKKYFRHVKVFLTWCLEEGHMEKAPGANIKVRGGKTVNKRPPFTENEIDALIASPLYAGHGSKRHLPGNTVTKDGLYWGPLIGLLTGMRGGEVMQITKEDVKHTKSGTYYFDLTAQEAGSSKKRLKTESSARQVPVHHYLVSLGLIEYANSLPKKARLLHDITMTSADDISRQLGKIFSAYLKKIGIQGKSFHCFRHTMRNMLTRAKADPTHIAAILGHEQQGTSFDSYGTDIPADVSDESINKITIPAIVKLVKQAKP